MTKTRQNVILANPLLQAIDYIYKSAFCPCPPRINVTAAIWGAAGMPSWWLCSNTPIGYSAVVLGATDQHICYIYPYVNQSASGWFVRKKNSMRVLSYHLTSERTTQRSANQTSKSQNKREREKKRSKITSIWHVDGKEYKILLKQMFSVVS